MKESRCNIFVYYPLEIFHNSVFIRLNEQIIDSFSHIVFKHANPFSLIQPIFIYHIFAIFLLIEIISFSFFFLYIFTVFVTVWVWMWVRGKLDDHKNTPPPPPPHITYTHTLRNSHGIQGNQAIEGNSRNLRNSRLDKKLYPLPLVSLSPKMMVVF
jgi:hypothetical protein